MERGAASLASWAAGIRAAHERIAPHVRRTPVEPSPWLSAATGAEVWVKLESHQITGSFKARGAVNRVLAADLETRRRGFVAASTGNHGAALAYAAGLVGAPATVFVPATADPDKVRRLRASAVRVEVAGQDCVEAEAAARAAARSEGATYVSPYNDPAVVAGQGTVGRELAAQVPGLDAVFVALGGGGLLGGCAAWLKAARPETEIVACSPRNSAVMMRSLAAGRILDLPSLPTLSDGTAGGVEPGAITFELCRELIDRQVEVEEAAIAWALRAFVGHHHALIEGAAAVPIAALLAMERNFAGRKVAVVLCGANIAPAKLGEILRDEALPPA
ncbi:MAG: threonine/serine dehydratase [Acidobacteriota bacterium]|nr:threonine/serine dehydratase [Acidobacteriota bacterium]